MNSKIKLYQELDKTLSNIKLIEMKIKKCEFFIEELQTNKPHFFQIKKYNNYKLNLDILYNDYNTNNNILQKELLTLEQIQEQIQELSQN
mgnify:FL=1